jgi:hypothetical protein
MLVLWLVTKYTISGKVMASPKSGLWWVLWVQICSWFVLAPKVLKLCINQLVVWFVQVRVSNWCLSFFLIPSPNSSTPFYTRSAVSQGMCPNFLLFHYFHLRLTFEFIKRVESELVDTTHTIPSNDKPYLFLVRFQG